jgi:hypothetical protein
MGLLASEKFKPTIFVGLGGNGGKIVNMLARKLKRHAAWNRIQNLVHFLAIDTNKDDLDKFRNVAPDCRFLVSSFDARAYVERKRGNRELSEDPRLTQWVPTNYAFRSTQGAGAGQIRLESRLRLYYNLEEDRAGIRKKINQMLQQSTSREDPWRDNEDKVVRVVLFCSVAGGTGSGGFLPMSYLLRDMVLDAGWGRPNVTGFLTLPTAFLDKVKPQLHADIMANGYAALKELEFLTRQLDYKDGSGKVEFHYDPGTLDPERLSVQERPFSIAYLIDRPDQVSIERYEAAVADAAFLQMFSSLLGAQAGEYDNYEKHQKQLALGHFTVHYGGLGTALLQLPRNDVLRYSSLRYTARAFRDFLCFGANTSAINYADPAFQKLDQREKNRRIDEAFLRYIEERASEEESRNEKGIFFGVKAQLGAGGNPLMVLFKQKLDAILTKLTNLTSEIENADLVSINPGNPSLRRPESTLRKQYADVSAKAQGEMLEGLLSQLKTGQLFREFFGEDVNPLAQRLFLIRLLGEDFIAPSDDAKELLKAEGIDFNPSDPNLQKQLMQAEKGLGAAAQQGMFEKLLDRDNAKFNAAKKVAKGFLDKLVREAQDDILRRFWRQFESKLREKAEELAGRFRELARLSDEATRQLESDAERFQRDPGADPESDVAQHYLDAEVLKDDRKNDRLWHVLYAHKLEAASWKSQEIFKAVAGAFREERGADGVLRVPDAGEICSRIRSGLISSARATFAQTLEEAQLDLASGLDLEQRYIAVLAAHDLKALQQSGKLDDQVKAVPESIVELGVRDRLKRLNEQCTLLAHVDPTKKDDPSVTPAEVFLVGLADKFNSDEPSSVGNLLKQVVNKQPGFVTGWEDRDAMVLYRSTLGVPIYFFRNVQAELYSSYKRVRDDTNRSYPLHIEAAWENGGLPDLDPLEQKRADKRRKQEEEAATKRSAEHQGIRDFALASIFGGVVKEDAGYVWTSFGAKGLLGTDRSSAFASFLALDPTMRSDVLEPSLAKWGQATHDKISREQVIGEVRMHEQRLKEAYARALASQLDAERRHVSSEREVVTALLQELGA